MFGYVNIYKPELKCKDFEIYNAIYCGLCREMGKKYGIGSTLYLNYDVAFLSLLAAALGERCDGYEQRHCRVNPLKKCTYCKNDGEYQELAAAVAVVLTDMKLKDNVKDGNIFFKAIFSFLRVFRYPAAKKAYKSHPELLPVIKKYAEGQAAVEKNEAATLDEAAEPTAAALKGIFSMIKAEEKYKFVLERIGYCLGKWIYLCDCGDDIEKDIRSGGFNPLKREIPENTDVKEYAKERLLPILNNCRMECAKYCDLLDIERYKEIIDNILFDGMRYRQEKIFIKGAGK